MIALAFMLVSTGTPQGFVSGVGLSSCREAYAEARLSPFAYQALERWIVGFWSGLNYANGSAVGAAAVQHDMFAIGNEVARECMAHPDEPVFKAELRVYERFEAADRRVPK